MSFYDICHMTWNVINYVNMDIKRTLLIRRIDLEVFNIYWNKINWNSDISFVFLLTFHCKFWWLWAVWTLNLLQKVIYIWDIHGMTTFIWGVFSWWEHFYFFFNHPNVSWSLDDFFGESMVLEELYQVPLYVIIWSTGMWPFLPLVRRDIGKWVLER